MKIGVVIADAGRARIFSTKRLGAALEPLSDMSNPQSKVLEQQLISDRHGHGNSPSGTGHSVSDRGELKDQESHHFAHGVARQLQENHRDNHFDRLYLVAAPRFLGHLRQELSPELQGLVQGEFAKDLSLMSEADIQRHLSHLHPLH